MVYRQPSNQLFSSQTIKQSSLWVFHTSYLATFHEPSFTAMKPSSLTIQPSKQSKIQSNSLPSFQVSSLLTFPPSSTDPQSLEQLTFWQQSLNRHGSVQCTQLYCIVPRCTKQHNITLLLAKLHYAALSCTEIRWTLLHHYIALHLARGCTETGCRHFTIKVFEIVLG